MRICSLQAKYFFSYRTLNLQFPPTGLILLSGKYGSGKSVVPELIYYFLTGEPLRKVPLAKVVRNKRPRAYGRLVIEEEGKQYAIDREIKKTPTGTTSKLSLWVQAGSDWEPVTAATRALLKKKLADLVGFSPLVLKTSTFFTKRFQFVALPDAEKKAILDDLIPELAALQVGAAAVKESLDGVKEEVQTQESSQGRLEDRLHDLATDLADLTNKSARFEEEKKANITRRALVLEAAREELTEPDAPRVQGPSPIEEIDSALAKLRKQLGAQAEIAAGESLEIEQREEQIREASLARRTLQAKVASLAPAGECYACGQRVTEGGAEEHRREVFAQALKATEALQDLTQAQEASKDRLRPVEAAVSRLQKEIRNLERDRDRALADAELRQAKADARLREKKTAVRTAKEALAEARAAEDPHGSGIEEKRARLKKVKLKLGKVKVLLEGALSDLEHLRFCEKAFGNQGLRSYILDSILPLLSYEASTRVKRLSQDRIDLKFKAQTEIGSGELRDKLDLEVTNMEGAKDYPGSSFGEQGRLDLGVAMALHVTSEQRSGRSIGVLVLDELLDALDPEGAEGAIEVIGELAKSKLVLAISHRPELKSLFSHIWKFSKHKGISEVMI